MMTNVVTLQNVISDWRRFCLKSDNNSTAGYVKSAYNNQSCKSMYYITQLEGARESAYLRQVNFDRCPFFEKFLRGHVQTVLGNARVTD